MAISPFDREMKKGSAELLVLSLVDGRARHGYEIGKLIETDIFLCYSSRTFKTGNQAEQK